MSSACQRAASTKASDDAECVADDCCQRAVELLPCRCFASAADATSDWDPACRVAAAVEPAACWALEEEHSGAGRWAERAGNRCGRFSSGASPRSASA